MVALPKWVLLTNVFRVEKTYTYDICTIISYIVKCFQNKCLHFTTPILFQNSIPFFWLRIKVAIIYYGVTCGMKNACMCDICKLIWCHREQFLNTHPKMWALQLTLVSKWQRLFNNKGPSGVRAKWGWNGSVIHIYPQKRVSIGCDPSHPIHEHYVSIRDKHFAWWMLKSNCHVCQLGQTTTHEQLAFKLDGLQPLLFVLGIVVGLATYWV